MRVKCCKCEQTYNLNDCLYDEDKTSRPILECPHCGFRHIVDFVPVEGEAAESREKIEKLNLTDYWPTLGGTRIANSSRVDQSGSDDGDVIDWSTSDEFIVACRIDGHATKNVGNQTYGLYWQDASDVSGFTILTSSGEIAWGTTTDLVDGNALTSAENIVSDHGSYGWTDGWEVEGANTSSAVTLTSEKYTEIQWAIDPAAADGGNRYEFQLWDIGRNTLIDTCGADITMAAGATYTKTADLDAILRATKLQLTDLDAILRATSTVDTDIDAILRSVANRVSDLDAVLRLTKFETADIDAILRLTKTKDLDLDAVLQLLASVSKDLDLDAILRLTGSKDLDLDAILRLTGSKDLDLDAFLKIVKTEDIDLDAILLLTKIKTLVLDAILQSPSVPSAGVVGLVPRIVTSWQKPLRGTRLNHSHPLARGLLFALPFNDLTGDRCFNVEGTARFYGSYNNPDANMWNGGILNFDGNDGSLSLIGTTNAAEASNTWLMYYPKTSFVFKVRKNASIADDETILSAWGDAQARRALRFDMDVSTDKWNGRVNDSDVDILSDDVVTIGKWYSVVMTVDFSSTTGVKMYLDGVLQAAVGNPTNEEDFNDPTSIIKLGCRSRTTDDVDDQFATCSFEYFYMYDRVLTPTEAVWLHREPYAMFQQPSFKFFIEEAAAQTKTVDFDAILRWSATEILNIDATLKAIKEASVDLDAVITDIVWELDDLVLGILSRQTLATDLDAILRAVSSAGVDLDAILSGLATYTKTLDLDAALRLTKTKDLDLDAVLRLTKLNTTDLDAILRLTKLNTTDLDAILRLTKSKDLDLDAILRFTKSKDLDLDAILRLTTLDSLDLDAILKLIGTKDVDLDAVLKLTKLDTLDLDAVLKLIGTKDIDLDAILRLTKLDTLDLDAILRLTKLDTLDLDAKLIATIAGLKDLDLDAVLRLTKLDTLDLDAILKFVKAEAIDLDAVLRLTTLSALDLDAVLKLIGTKDIDLDAVLRVTKLDSLDLDAILYIMGSKNIDLDAILRLTKLDAMDLDAILQLVSIKDIDLDAILQLVGAKAIDLDAIFRLTSTKEVDLDAIFRRTALKSLDLDALIKYVKMVNVDLDALLRLTKIHAIDLDATLVTQFYEKLVTLDALLQALGSPNKILKSAIIARFYSNINNVFPK